MRRFCIALIVLIIVVPSAFANGKLGVNIAGRYTDFEQALSFAGENGWIVIASEPTERLSSFILGAQEKKIHVIIRGHYPGIALTTQYAQQWVNFFATHNFPNRVYFIPANEPNNTQENTGSIDSVKTYTQYLLDQVSAQGLRKTSVYILAPALDIYQLADTNSAIYTQMGGPTFFSQFDGIPLHLYVEMTPQGIVDESVHPYKMGNWKKILADMKLENMPVFIDETGVRCFSCTTPDVGGKDKVKYPYGASYQKIYANFLTYVKNKQDWGNAQVRTFDVLSYDPVDFGRSSWLSENGIQDMNTLGESIGSTEDVVYATEHGTNTVFNSQTGSGITTGTQTEKNLFSLATDTFLMNAGGAKPAALVMQDTDTHKVFSQKKAVENADFARSGHVSATAETIEEKQGFWQKIQDAVTDLSAAFGFILDSATSKNVGYALSLSPQLAHTAFSGRGAGVVDLSGESESVHSKLLAWYTPYSMHTTVVRSAPLNNTQVVIAGSSADVVPETGTTSDVVPSQTSSDAARKLFLITGYGCGWARIEGVVLTEKLTIPITKDNYTCLQKPLKDESGKPFLMSTGAYELLKASAQSYKYLQCVGFAMATQKEKIILPAAQDSATGLSGNTWIHSDFIDPNLAIEGRNAKDYCSYNAPKGYARFVPDPKDSTGGIRVGDLVVWTYAPWGHIAVVGNVNPKNKTISVYEANWGGKGVVHSRQTVALQVDCYLRSK
ncbi:MAG: CHAP domain-containing protein [Candidatus Roizmanbacteria bacterium]|nr:CHAP domain-containing protein [Candidatus Roizmanbacteria bacterium]